MSAKTKKFPRRASWQMPFEPSIGAGSRTLSLVSDGSAPFYALRLIVTPRGAGPTDLRRNGEPARDHLGRPIDGAWFERWRMPAIFAPSGADLYELNKNGVRLVVEPGDRLTLALRRPGRAVLVGFVEEK